MQNSPEPMKRASASALKTYKECKLLFYANYVADGPHIRTSSIFTDLGNAVHTALELWRPTGDATMAGRAQLIRHFTAALPDNSPLRKQGIQMLSTLDLRQLMPGDLLCTEYYFEMEVSNVPVVGYIDKIEDCGEYILCTDYKTNTKIDKAAYAHQLAIYDTYLKTQIDKPIVHELFYVRFNKSLKFDFPDVTKKLVTNALVEMVEASKDKNIAHWPKKSKKDSGCKYCPLLGVCWP